MAKFFIPPPPFAVADGPLAPPFKMQKSPPMTAAERQRRCRARGGGKHRGRRGPTAAQRRKAGLVLLGMDLATAPSAEAVLPTEAAMSAGAVAAPIGASAAPPTIDWGISAMAA